MLIEGRRAPQLTIADAERIARDLFGIEASASALAGELDDNFRLTTSDGTHLVLKIMRAGCDPRLVDLQIRALEHLRGIAVPKLIQAVAQTDGRLVWMLDWLPGRVLAESGRTTPEMLRDLGRLLGTVDAALKTFSHPAAHRNFKWDLKRAAWIRDYPQYTGARRPMVEQILARFEMQAPALARLRHSVIHGDANDHNVLVDGGRLALLDFGDLHYGATVAELAVGCAYAAFGEPEPLAAIANVVRGYHETYPLEEREIELLFDLILTRLAVSVVNSSYLSSISGGDAYVTISEQHAWAAIEQLIAIDPRLAHYTLRQACGFEPVPHAAAVRDWLARSRPRPVMNGLTDPVVFDLSFGSLMLGADPRNCETGPLTEILFSKLRGNIGIGRYNEARPIYTAPAFASGPHPTDEHRTIHIGLDFFAEPGTPVFAPYDGAVHAFANNAARLDYGPVIVLRHQTSGGAPFFTLYGHLSLDSIQELDLDQPIAAGQRVGWIGAPPANGDWPPHLHLQVITDLLDLNTDFPGVAYPSQREIWLSLSPDPNLIAKIAPEKLAPEPAKSQTLSSRRAHLGRNLSLSYREPLKMVRGWRQYLYDETGRAFLDVYNNVPLVGHSHPRVVEAVQRQAALLNTNTRYLHDNITRYAERLTAYFPEPLRVCYFLNSASEANELALRLARAHTGNHDVIVLQHAYHGNTNTLIDISPYKFNGPGGSGRKPWVHVAPQPDPHRRNDPSAGLAYALEVEAIARRTRPAAFIAESLPSVGGQVVFPPGYLVQAYRHVRSAGGVCIADEVQVGFGRLGAHFWGFEMQGVVPDIVVLGKPMGNGFPLAGVVTTAPIAESFDNGMEFFSTFGGNPVACAAGLAVLDVLEEEHLQENARDTGVYLMRELRKLDVVDVRGAGLFIGVELSTAEQASDAVNGLRDRGILAGTDGPLHNVIKIRPPLIFSRDDADFFVSVLKDYCQPPPKAR